ncbi:hypothetical protein F5Y12DRAFT_762384 [Xylaria sp. FL1777]|nr:hypothetical protein F5Y12DRAFT_762384 [Xylaria sp. FL1777]
MEEDRALTEQPVDAPSPILDGALIPHEETSFSLNNGQTICVLVFFLVELYELIIIAPTAALIEVFICWQYFEKVDLAVISRGRGINSAMCKNNYVQSELATVLGWKAVFDSIPVFILSFLLEPCLARFGSSKLLVASLIGLIGSTIWFTFICAYPETYPIKLVWASSIFLFCGGGLSQVAAVTHLVGSELAGDANTSLIFHVLNVAYMVDELLAPGLASFAMQTSLFLPIIIGICSLLMAIATVTRLPIIGLAAPVGHLEQPNVAAVDTSRIIAALKNNRIYRDWEYVQQSWNRNLIATLPIFFFGMFRPAALRVYLQYTSIRLKYTLSAAAAITSGVSAVNLVLFVSVPLIWAWMGGNANRASRPEIDIRIVRYTLFLTCVGCIMIAWAENISTLVTGSILFVTSVGTRPSLLSLGIFLIGSDRKPHLFEILQIVENTSMVLSDFILQGALRLALEQSRLWLGLPFLVMFSFNFIAYLFSIAIKI